MKAIAVFALVLVFVGACLAEGLEKIEQNCPCTKEDRQLFVKCLNESKKGECDFEAFMIDPEDYLNLEEKRTTASCIFKEKGLITPEGKLDHALIKAEIQKSKASEDIRNKLDVAYDECVENHKDSDEYCTEDTIICSLTKGAEICGN